MLLSGLPNQAGFSWRSCHMCPIWARTSVTIFGRATDLPEGRCPVLRAMQTAEASRPPSWCFPGMQRPYVHPSTAWTTSVPTRLVANFGALGRGGGGGPTRNCGSPVRMAATRRTPAAAARRHVRLLAPTDDNPEAIRYACGPATDEALQNALARYTATARRAEGAFQTPADPEKDFAPAKACQSIGPLVPLNRPARSGSGASWRPAPLRQRPGGPPPMPQMCSIRPPACAAWR